MLILKEIKLIVCNTYGIFGVGAFQVALWVRCNRGAEALMRTVSQLSTYYNMGVNGGVASEKLRMPALQKRLILGRGAEGAKGIGNFRSENLKFERVRTYHRQVTQAGLIPR